VSENIANIFMPRTSGDGIITPMYPDLLIARNYKKGYIFYVLKPNDPSRNDNVSKTIGLTKFA